MKRYIALVAMLATLCGCASNAPVTTVVTETTTAETTAATTFPTEETTLPEETSPVIAGFDPLQIIASMTLEEKVGQLFLARCPGENAIE